MSVRFKHFFRTAMDTACNYEEAMPSSQTKKLQNVGCAPGVRWNWHFDISVSRLNESRNFKWKN